MSILTKVGVGEDSTDVAEAVMADATDVGGGSVEGEESPPQAITAKINKNAADRTMAKTLIFRFYQTE